MRCRSRMTGAQKLAVGDPGPAATGSTCFTSTDLRRWSHGDRHQPGAQRRGVPDGHRRRRIRRDGSVVAEHHLAGVRALGSRGTAVRIGGGAGCTTTTGHLAYGTTFRAVEPTSSPVKPSQPRAPITSSCAVSDAVSSDCTGGVG